MGVLGVIYYLKMFRTNALYHHSGSDSCSPKRFIRGLFFFPLACVMVIAICSFYTLVYDRRRLADSADVNNRHRRLIEDVEIECMQAIDFFQKNCFATMEPSDIGELAVDLWLKTHPESELANGNIDLFRKTHPESENDDLWQKTRKLIEECAWRAWVFATGGACEAGHKAERERLEAENGRCSQMSSSKCRKAKSDAGYCSSCGAKWIKGDAEEAADIQLQRQRRWRSFDWLKFREHEAALATHGKRMPIYDIDDDSQHPSEVDIRGNMPLLQPCGGAEPACSFGQKYIDNGKIKGRKALPKGDPDTTGYCITCEGTGAVSRPPWSAG